MSPSWREACWREACRRAHARRGRTASAGRTAPRSRSSGSRRRVRWRRPGAVARHLVHVWWRSRNARRAATRPAMSGRRFHTGPELGGQRTRRHRGGSATTAGKRLSRTAATEVQGSPGSPGVPGAAYRRVEPMRVRRRFRAALGRRRGTGMGDGRVGLRGARRVARGVRVRSRAACWSGAAVRVSKRRWSKGGRRAANGVARSTTGHRACAAERAEAVQVLSVGREQGVTRRRLGGAHTTRVREPGGPTVEAPMGPAFGAPVAPTVEAPIGRGRPDRRRRYNAGGPASPP